MSQKIQGNSPEVQRGNTLTAAQSTEIAIANFSSCLEKTKEKESLAILQSRVSIKKKKKKKGQKEGPCLLRESFTCLGTY